MGVVGVMGEPWKRITFLGFIYEWARSSTCVAQAAQVTNSLSWSFVHECTDGICIFGNGGVVAGLPEPSTEERPCPQHNLPDLEIRPAKKFCQEISSYLHRASRANECIHMTCHMLEVARGVSIHICDGVDRCEKKTSSG